MQTWILKLCIGLFSLNAFAINDFDAVLVSNWAKIGGNANAHSSAALEINSTTKGLLISRMTETQRDAISSPATGLMIYNTDTDVYNYYDGSGWEIIGSGVVDLTSDVSGVLPIVNGGTNSSTTLNNNRIIQSNGGALVEASAITASRLLVSDSNGIPTHSAVTSTEAGYLSNVNANIQDQFDSIIGGTNALREYNANGKAEKNTTGWSMYADAAGTSPVTGQGGSPSTTIARTTTSSEIIRETASFKLAKSAANRQGEGASYDFTVDPQDFKSSQALYISFDYSTTSNYAASDIQVFIYDKDAAALIPVFDSNGLTGAIPASTDGTKFTGYFYPTNVASDDYRLIFHITSTNASAYDFIFDSVHVGPIPFAPGAIITPWTSFTPTGTLTTNVTYTGLKRRVGDTEEYEILLTFSGTNTQGTASVNTASTIDTSKILSTSSGSSILGTVQYYDASGGSGTGRLIGSVIYSTTTSVDINTHLPDSAQNHYLRVISTTSGTLPVTVASGDKILLRFSIPVLGWTSGALVPTSEMLAKNPAATPTTLTSSVKTPGATGRYLSMTNNSMTLTPGVWMLWGTGLFGNSGSNPSYSQGGLGFFSSQGTDSGSAPTALTGCSGLTFLGVDTAQSSTSLLQTYMPINSSQSEIGTSPLLVKLTSSCTVYFVPYAVMSTAANARITVFANAIKMPDFSVFSAFGGVPSRSVFTSDGTWTDTQCKYIDVDLYGGGGGGGGAASTGASPMSVGSGGGSGGRSSRRMFAGEFTSSVSVTIGSGGTGVSANTGNTGGTTSFGAYLQATGGTGGNASSATIGSRVSIGGGGGVGSGGDVNSTGAIGNNGFGTSGLAMPGNGAATIYGGGGAGNTSATGGTAPSNSYGSGGGAASNGPSQSAVAGGAGAKGIVVVDCYR